MKLLAVFSEKLQNLLKALVREASAPKTNPRKARCVSEMCHYLPVYAVKHSCVGKVIALDYTTFVHDVIGMYFPLGRSKSYVTAYL